MRPHAVGRPATRLIAIKAVEHNAGFSLTVNGRWMMHMQTDNRVLDGATPPLRTKVAFLSSPAAYRGVEVVDARETHMAWVFLVGERVYKLKKPVRYPFLDYGTLEARRRICNEEVRLNRRLAPDVYLGVARLTVEDDGSLAVNGEGRIVDWLVEMRRLPDTLMLDYAIKSGTVSPHAVEAVADRLARFYREASPVNVDPAEQIARFTRELDKSREVFAEREFNSLAGRGLKILTQLQDLLNHAPEIVTDRVAAGRFIEAHGDLRPEHVCLSDPPVIIDCLEFSRDLRLVDPFDELSYLSMECAVLGARWIGPVLIERCATSLGDRPSERLLAFFTAYRASFRARQALAHLLELAPRTPEKWIPLARVYLDEAERSVVKLRLPEARPANHYRGGDG
jgi:aminoglycoside phosphotransferase family enzyme